MSNHILRYGRHQSSGRGSIQRMLMQFDIYRRHSYDATTTPAVIQKKGQQKSAARQCALRLDSRYKLLSFVSYVLLGALVSFICFRLKKCAH